MDVLVGTSKGLWRASRGPDEAFGDRSVTALGIAPTGVLVLVEHREVWLVGAVDTSLVASLDEPTGNCVVAFGDELLVGADDARILRVVDGEVEPVTGFDTVEGRDGWYTPWGAPPATRSLAVDEHDVIYANVHVGGVVVSTDRGVSWKPSSIDVDSDVHEVVSPSAGTLLAACGMGGLARTEDGGSTWSASHDGLHASYCRAVAVAGDTVLLSASTGPSTSRSAVYRRALDGAGAFSRCSDWLDDNVDSGCIGAGGQHAAFGTSDGRCFVSRDAGVTWDLAAEGLGAVSAVVVTGTG